LVEAFNAYRQALALKDDPTVRGRYGLILLEGGSLVNAAHDLLGAVERGGGTTERERKQFQDAFQAIRPRICQLRIKGSIYDATVAIDDEPLDSRGIGTAFKTWVLPGKHVVRGVSEQHGEVKQEVDCPKGKEADVFLQWPTPEPKPESPPIEPQPAPALPTAPAPSVERTLAIIDRRNPARDDWPRSEPSERAANNGRASGVRWSIGAGPALVLGAASWLPSFGATLAGSVRFGIASIDLDARAAWLTASIGGEPIQAMTAGALLSACAHWRVLFGCFTGHMGIIQVESTRDSYADAAFVGVRPGLGARAGIDVHIHDAFGLRLAADVVGLTRGTRVWVGPQVYADQPPVMVGSTLVGVWQF
jgi:hypothetical protein